VAGGSYASRITRGWGKAPKLASISCYALKRRFKMPKSYMRSVDGSPGISPFRGLGNEKEFSGRSLPRVVSMDWIFASKSTPGKSRSAERGATLIMFTMLTAMVIIPMIGLAIDESILYWTKAKLSAAVDAGALAVGRDLSGNSTTVAQSYVYANLPQGWLGTSYSPAPSALVQNDTPTLGTRRVTVSASVTVPLYFMRILGQSNATVSASGVSSRRDTNIILIIDRSYSMQIAGVCGTMISSAKSFVNNFADGRDTLSLISYSTTANADFPPNPSFKPALNNKLDTAACNGYTNTASALNLAYTQIKGIPNASTKLNVIVLFTDGIPDAIQGDFVGDGTNNATNPIRRMADTRYDWLNTSTTATPAASGCGTSAHLTGVLVDTPGTSSPPPPKGQTGGLYNPTGVQISTDVLLPGVVSNACGSFAGAGNATKVRNDIAYLPSADAFGNLLAGFRTLSSGTDPDYYPSGNPYHTYLRSDSPQSVMHAAENAADAQAHAIRNDGTYKTVIYTIGLGGTPTQHIDDELLERIANDPRSTNYNSSQSTGEYIPCTAAGLASAFQQVASQILHLAQ
jgi:Flp pilus assembly protein TadG